MKKIFKLVLAVLLIGATMIAPGFTQSKTALAVDDAVYQKIMSNKKIVIGTSAPFAPYEFYDQNNKLQGLDIELGKKLGEQLGVDVEFVNMSFDVLIGALSTGQVDIALSDITPTDERKQTVDFSEIYYTSEVGIMVKKSNVDQYPDNTKFEGKTLGAQAGSVQEELATEELKAGSVLSLPDIPALAINLQNDKVDGIVIEDTVGKDLMQTYPDFVFAPEMIPAGDAAIALQKNSPTLLAECNKLIKELKASGEIDKMYEAAATLSKGMTEEQMQGTGADATQVVATAKKSQFQEYGPLFLQGTIYTIAISLAAILIGIVFGLIFVLGRDLPYVGWIFKSIVAFLRGTPIIVQLFIFVFVVFGSWITLPTAIFGSQGYLTVAALCALGLNSGAYISEIMRAGINGVDKGQFEAARSLGLSHSQTMKSIILPQAVKNILPALGNEFIVIIKESAIVTMIGVVDIMKSSQIMQSKTYEPFVPYAIAACIYFVLTFVMAQLVKVLERRLAVSDRG